MNPGIGSSSKLAMWVGVLVIVLLLLSAGNLTVTDKEPAIFSASVSYDGWVNRIVAGPHGVLNQEVIRRAWEPNNSVAPLDQAWGGFVWSIAHYLLDDIFAHRLGNIILAGVLAALLFRIMSVEAGFWSGLAAVLALFLMPRFFTHAQLATTDVPAATTLVAVTYIFWRNKESARIRYAILMGLVLGIALAVDFRTIYILPTLLLWVILFRRKVYLFIRLILAGAIAAGVFFLCWPWLYYDTIARWTTFLQSQFSAHGSSPQWFLGNIPTVMPWYFPFLIVWAVVPLGTTILYIVGCLRAIPSRRTRPFGALLFLLAVVPLTILASGRLAVDGFDQTITPVFPFLAALAGLGFAWLVQGLHFLFRKLHRPAVTSMASLILIILLFAYPVYQYINLYPHLLAYYSEQVGGLQGARTMGLETTYWCTGCKEAVTYLNQNAKAGDTVWVDFPTRGVLDYYQAHGILREEFVMTGPAREEADGNPVVEQKDAQIRYTDSRFVILPYQRMVLFDAAGMPSELSQWASGQQSVFRLEKQGVPLLDIFNASP